MSVSRFGLALLASLTPSCAFADYIGDQIAACAAPLSPANRPAVIAACGAVIQMGELPAATEGEAFVNRGNAYAFGADFPHALADFAAAVDLMPKSPAPYAARGLALLKQKRFQDAWNDFDAAVKLESGNSAALYGRGLAARKLGRDGDPDMDVAAAGDPAMAQFYAGNGVVP
jgi:lipoprotein NlpI